MSRTIADAGEYKFGECGYIVDGALLIDGTKLKNIRIYRQRSYKLFDIIDPVTNKIYRRVQITSYDKVGNLLNYKKSDDELLDVIAKNTFFVRGYTNQLKPTDPTGFVTKFQLHKTIFGNSDVTFDMYTPTCSIIDRDIDNILVNPVHVGDTEISGKLFNAGQTINTTGMTITVKFSDGSEYSTSTIVNDEFIITVPEIMSTGTATITLTSDFYNTKSVNFNILDVGDDDGFTTTVSVTTFSTGPGDVYSARIPGDVHGRGNNLAIQVYDNHNNLVSAGINVSSTGDITVTIYDNTPIKLSILGSTLQTSPYVQNVSSSEWTRNGEMYEINISSTGHLKEFVFVQVYDNNNDAVQCEIQLDDDENVTITSAEAFDAKIVVIGYDKQ
ncbi:hypothetical protein FOI42_RS02625 [Escherichia coli]|nr:hypothetical protein [Escherichia coli]MED6699197.1 hypothetical protein [Escherichia coli O157]HCQ0858786.1 hypothetical protein [Escherichia coli]